VPAFIKEDKVFHNSNKKPIERPMITKNQQKRKKKKKKGASH